MEWYRDGDQQHCRAHGTVFALTAVCPTCSGVPLADLPPVIDTSAMREAVPAPAGCLSTIEIEQKLVTLAESASTSAREMLKPSATWRSRSLGVKLLDVAIKALRAASDHASTRERRERIASLEKRSARHRKGQN
jgi:hypothetical protein